MLRTLRPVFKKGELHIYLTTCWRWKDEFLTLMALLAVEEGLIRIED
ncbi:MAG: hypothetical protein ACPLRZ_11300 [Thermovenabulum sp.]